MPRVTKNFKTKICTVCGKTFKPSHGTQKYCCPECKKEGYYLTAKKRIINNFKQPKPKVKEKAEDPVHIPFSIAPKEFENRVTSRDAKFTDLELALLQGGIKSLNW